MKRAIRGWAILYSILLSHTNAQTPSSKDGSVRPIAQKYLDLEPGKRRVAGRRGKCKSRLVIYAKILSVAAKYLIAHVHGGSGVRSFFLLLGSCFLQ